MFNNQDSIAHKQMLKKQIKGRNQKVLEEMFKMMVLPRFMWIFMGEADSYRRRPFPLKFLQYECSDYPCYVFTSELSKAFNSISFIETEIDLSEYSSVLDIKRSKKMKDLPLVYSENESLVTSTREFIKNVLRWIFKNFKQTKIVPQNGYELTLKVDGYREYLMGNY